MNSDCPACDGPLAPGARQCRCGWKAEVLAQPQLGLQRYLREKMAADDERRRIEADKWCKENGLVQQPDETVEQFRHRRLMWVKDKLSKFGKRAA